MAANKRRQNAKLGSSKIDVTQSTMRETQEQSTTVNDTQSEMSSEYGASSFAGRHFITATKAHGPKVISPEVQVSAFSDLTSPSQVKLVDSSSQLVPLQSTGPPSEVTERLNIYHREMKNMIALMEDLQRIDKNNDDVQAI